MCDRWWCPFCLYRDCALPTGEDCIYEDEDRAEDERWDDLGDRIFHERMEAQNV